MTAMQDVPLLCAQACGSSDGSRSQKYERDERRYDRVNEMRRGWAEAEEEQESTRKASDHSQMTAGQLIMPRSLHMLVTARENFGGTEAQI